MLLWSTEFWDTQEIPYTIDVVGSREIFTTVIGNNLFSGFLGPFGGPTPRKNNTLPQDHSDLSQVIDLAIAKTKMQGLESLFFRLPPRNFYSLDSSDLESILLEKNFHLLHIDTNHSQNLLEDNILLFNRNRKRDYKYWSEKGARFISPSSSPLMAFDCLVENRKLRNLNTSITFSQAISKSLLSATRGGQGIGEIIFGGTPTGNGNGKYNFIKEIDIFDFVCFLLVVSHKGILITFAKVSLPVGQLRIVCKSR